MHVECPDCGESHNVPADSVGRRFKCSGCGRVVEVEEASKPKPTSGLFETSRVQGSALLLLAISAADLFMTYTLLRSNPRFFESNPVAQWFFVRWNIAGLVLFKFGMVAGVIALSEFIERRKAGRGKFVLWVGSIAAGYAVYKGLSLYLEHGPAPFAQ